ncbi:MAG: lipopolysaccharide biosynthesis protein [Planctomycetota bacterium]
MTSELGGESAGGDSNRVEQRNRWLAGMSIADQGLVSACGFLTVVAVGRGVSMQSLGVYSLAYSLIVLVSTLIRALIVTPYTVFSRRETGLRREQMRGACRRLLLISLTTIALTTAVIGAVAFLAGSELWLIVCATGAAMAGVSIREFSRRLSFSDLRFSDALIMDTAGGFILLTYLAVEFRSLSVPAVLIVLAISSALPAITLLWVRRGDFSIAKESLRDDIVRNLTFGRWVAVSQVTHAAHGYVVHWILAAVGGVATTGLYAAAWSVVQLASPFIQGVGNFAGPCLSNTLAQGGESQLRKGVRQLSRVLALTLAPYTLALAVAGPSIHGLLFNSEETPLRWLTGILALGLSLGAVVLPHGKAISVMEKPYWNSLLNGVNLVSTCVVVLILTRIAGLMGAACGLLFVTTMISFAKFCASEYLLARHNDRPVESRLAEAR